MRMRVCVCVCVHVCAILHKLISATTSCKMEVVWLETMHVYSI